MKKLLVLVSALAVCMGSAYAYTINDVQVMRHGERYLITLNVDMDAPVEAVKAVISDFEHTAMLTPAVKSTEVYRFDDETVRLRAVMRPCVYIFCRTLTKLSIVRLNEDNIQMFGIENAGSFRYARESLKFEPLDGGSKIMYKGDISPDFYMPSWLGVRFIRSSLRKYLDEVLTNIENEAKASA